MKIFSVLVAVKPGAVACFHSIFGLAAKSKRDNINTAVNRVRNARMSKTYIFGTIKNNK